MTLSDGSESTLGFLRAPFKSGGRWFVPYSKASRLYHYTNLAGFRGILTEGGFWLSNTNYMNDIEEIIHGTKMAVEIIDKLVCKRRFPWFEAELLNARNLLVGEQANVYVASFSRVDDDLNQWRAYCQNGGVSIGLDTEVDGRNDLSFVAHPRYVTHDVVYGDFEKRRRIFNVLNSFAEEYKIDLDRDGIVHLGKQFATEIAGNCAHIIRTFKNSCFRSEHETRIICGDMRVNKEAKVNWEREFRPTENFLVSYYSIGKFIKILKPPQNHRLPIRSVTVGPCRYPKQVIRSIEDFLLNLGYDTVRVSASKVPYRA